MVGQFGKGGLVFRDLRAVGKKQIVIFSYNGSVVWCEVFQCQINMTMD